MPTKKQRAVTDQVTAEFEVLSNLHHDGDDYAPGETVELTEAQALALGPQVIKPLAVAPDAKS